MWSGWFEYRGSGTVAGDPSTASMNAKLRTLAIVALVAVGTAAGIAIAASNGSLTASPATPGETSTHTATLTAEDATAGSLTGFQVDYGEAGVDVSNVGVENVQTIGIDEGDDAEGDTVDQNVSDDLDSVTASNDGATVTFELGGNYDLTAGDEVVVVFENVQNGDAGEYEASLDINPQSSGGDGMATLTISEDATGTGTEDVTTQQRSKNVTSTGTASDSESTTETTSSDQTTQEEEEENQENQETTSGENGIDDTETEMGAGDGTDGQDGTDASGPGFGVAVTLLALLGAAFLTMGRTN